MGGDRRKASHSIEVPLSIMPQQNPRKRPPSYTHECTEEQCDQDEMNACHAALILMKLSNSPSSPKNGEKWLGSSPGSSSASWSSGSSSPPLSDDGHAAHPHASVMLHDATANARIRTTSVSTSDEGIVVDFKEEAPRKKRASKSKFVCTWKGCHFVEHTPPKIERHIRIVHLGYSSKRPRRSADNDGSLSESDHEEEFYYTEIEDEDDDAKSPSPTSPPTLSHRDMARPPHEDPEYQRQIVGNFKQGRIANAQQQLCSGKQVVYGKSHLNNNLNTHQPLVTNHSTALPTSPLAHHNYTWPSTAAIGTNTVSSSTSMTSHSMTQQQNTTPVKHARSSPRPSQSSAPYPSPTYIHQQQQHQYYQLSNSNNNIDSSKNNINNPIVQSNDSANNMLQQLSQQNITVTPHHRCNTNTNHQNIQQHMSTVTLTSNYQSNKSHQQLVRHQTPTNGTANNSTSQHHTLSHLQQIPQQHVVQLNAGSTKHSPNSPNRRTRGENKKCRKVYGMDRRDQWCTQCRWKKACSRFGD